jgi:glycosyltransferase involved in cell wall biosynthesis
VAALVEDLEALDGGPVDGLHGYFAHEPTAVAAAAARRLGVGYSFSTHALDARKVSARELADRARQAVGVVACNADVAQHVDVPGASVRLLPHGVDLARFRPSAGTVDGSALRVLAVGRMVEKKGFPHLLDAVARARSDIALRIVGTGVGRETLERQVADLGLAAHVELVGRRSHSQLPDDYAWADVVAVPSVVDSSGDRDGLPNVALEAMACGRPLVASDVAAMGAAVRASGAGIVVRPGDADAIAAALDDLADHPRRRADLGAAGRAAVEQRWDLATCTRELVEHLTTLHDPAPAKEKASA